ncbi:MAG: tetratricopeptide repeat protein [Magnetococcales bacterium]|nr:tetratricopeptide repeat protein [Magnetococcales bacterium]
MNENKPSQPTDSNKSELTVDEAYTRAIGLIKAERYKEADQLCTTLLQLVPNNIQLINLLGVIAQKVNRHDLAIEQFQKAINIDDSSALLFYNLGTSLYPVGRKSEAIQVIKTAIRKDPENKQYKEYLNGIENNTIPLPENPDNQEQAESFLQKGAKLHKTGHIDEAIYWYHRVLEIQPKHTAALSNLGSALRFQGKFDEAITCYQQAIIIQPDLSDAHYNLANTLKEQGRIDEAINIYRNTILVKPDFAQAHCNLGSALKEQGKIDEAITSFKKAVAIKPDYFTAHYNLGNSLKEKGKLDEAADCYNNALSHNPNFVQALCNLGATQCDRGKLDYATACLQKAIAIKPDYYDAYCNLGNTFKKLGKLDDAAACLQKAIDLKPEISLAHCNLGVIFLKQGKLGNAIISLQKAIEITPTYAEAFSNLGVALKDQGKLKEAARSYHKAVTIKPDFFEAHFNLGNVLNTQGRLDEAAICFQNAITINPNYVEAFSNLASNLKAQGKIDEALVCYQNALAIKPNFHEAHSNLLLCLQYFNGDLKHILDQHKLWNTRHTQHLPTSICSQQKSDDPNKLLHVGFVSGDFHKHSVSYFLESFFESYNKKKFVFHCYSNSHLEDAVTKRLQENVKKWRNIFGQNDDAVVEMIQSDKIDILVDLSGHTKNNRLLLFARKPAPIQVTYLGYPNTTGLDAIDYRITDNIADPQGYADQYCVEELVRLENGFLCYTPPSATPDVSPLNMKKAGYVTFVSFNNLAKISKDVIKVWAEILKRVPDSRLLIKNKSMGCQSVKERYISMFNQESIDSTRLTLLPRTEETQDHFATYANGDVCLDPFPYNGATTTCEALWMGMPVIVLRGDRHSSRVGASILTQVGLDELIANDVEEYIEKAVVLANDPARLKKYRKKLRTRVKKSSICDSKEFSKNMGTAFRDIWKKWCAQEDS